MDGRRLRIGIDAHALGRRQTGNERFIANLIRGLQILGNHELVLYLGRNGASTTPSIGTRTRLHVMRSEHPAARLLWHLSSCARRDALDVLLVQYVAPPIAPCPIVAVVHDIAFSRFPDDYSRTERVWMPTAIPATMRRAAGVVTVSEFSRDEIAGRYRIPVSRIAVAPNAVDPIFRRTIEHRPLHDPPYFLAIGNLQPRKNLGTLVQAYRALARRRPDLPERLVIVGQPRRGARTPGPAAADAADDGRVVFTGYVPDEVVLGLLRHATAFAYPSLYEGFGLPVIEAMATGAPTIVGDIPVMREVAGDDAIRVSATEVDAWTDALERIATDPDLRADLARRGRARAARFTPEASAAPVLRMLEAVARRR